MRPICDGPWQRCNEIAATRTNEVIAAVEAADVVVVAAKSRLPFRKINTIFQSKPVFKPLLLKALI
jgi:hypothetical protein